MEFTVLALFAQPGLVCPDAIHVRAGATARGDRLGTCSRCEPLDAVNASATASGGAKLEGCLRLMSLLMAAQASIIHVVLGIRKRRSANRGSYGLKTAAMPIEAPEQPEKIAAEIYA